MEKISIPMFNGIRVLVMNDTIAYDPDNSGWKDDASNLIIQGSLLRQLPGRVHGYPSSYEIRVGDLIHPGVLDIGLQPTSRFGMFMKMKNHYSISGNRQGSRMKKYRLVII